MCKTDNSGGCIVSKNLLNKQGKLKWCFRENSMNDIDTGWRFLSDIDTEEYINDSSNLSVCSISSIIQLEPAVLSILHLPTGTDISLEYEGSKKFFVDSDGERI